MRSRGGACALDHAAACAAHERECTQRKRDEGGGCEVSGRCRAAATDARTYVAFAAATSTVAEGPWVCPKLSRGCLRGSRRELVPP